MKLILSGQDIELTEAIKQYLEKKISRLERFFKNFNPEEIEVKAVLRKDGLETRVEINLIVLQTGEKIHAWESDGNLYSALDKVIDEIEKQLTKDKEKHLNNIRQAKKEKALLKAPSERKPSFRPQVEEEELIIDKPMAIEDAILELEEKKLQFLPFVDISNGELKILYRKKAGNYGLIRTSCRI
jgi:putative sigma-54 modulation protein